METPNIENAFEELSGGQPMEMSVLRDTAYRLFRGKQIEFINLPPNENKDHHSFLILIDNRMTLWFFKKENIWQFDGWEMGDYTNAWQQFRL